MMHVMQSARENPPGLEQLVTAYRPETARHGQHDDDAQHGVRAQRCAERHAGGRDESAFEHEQRTPERDGGLDQHARAAQMAGAFGGRAATVRAAAKESDRHQGDHEQHNPVCQVHRCTPAIHPGLSGVPGTKTIRPVLNRRTR
ncbi:hypothetical protein PT2222_240035 [Paraburkholderia tropica]